MVVLLMLFMVSVDLYSEIKTQNNLYIEVDPLNATTVFVELDDTLKVETWDEEYILFQIMVESCSEAPEILNSLVKHKENIIKQEFKPNDFLFLTIKDFSELMDISENILDEKLDYKITVPIHLDLELKCNNDLMIYLDPEDIHPLESKQFTPKFN